MIPPFSLATPFAQAVGPPPDEPLEPTGGTDVPSDPLRSRALRVALMMLAAGFMILLLLVFADDKSPTKPIQVVPKEEEPPTPIPADEPLFPPFGFWVDDATDRLDHWPRALICVKDNSRLVQIPGGLFERGHLPGADPHPEDEDEPAHLVKLPRFYMQETEVTNGQMTLYFNEVDPQGHSIDYLEWHQAVRKLREAGVTDVEVARHPATRVSHRLAIKYARWAKGSLPTEAHWEFAARSGGLNRLYVWTGSALPAPSLANIDIARPSTPGDPSGLLTLPVKSLKTDRTDQGVYDLTGNVREWCRERWSSYDSNRPRQTHGELPWYSVRGGAFDTPRSAFRTTCHGGRERADTLAYDLGFRIIVECH